MKVRMLNFLAVFLVVFCMQNCFAMKGKPYRSDSDEEIKGDIREILVQHGAQREKITKELLKQYLFQFKVRGELNYKFIVKSHKLSEENDEVATADFFFRKTGS